ncbi:hypothetical protein Hanom_Chr07g00650541 [Helianthus anomalus]
MELFENISRRLELQISDKELNVYRNGCISLTGGTRSISIISLQSHICNTSLLSDYFLVFCFFWLLRLGPRLALCALSAPCAFDNYVIDMQMGLKSEHKLEV